MYSMTGYGKGEYSEEGLELVVEIRSVNNRYFDLSVKSPRIFLSCEERIRKAVREKISRGHLDVFVSYTDRRERERGVSADLSAARAYVERLEQLVGCRIQYISVGPEREACIIR